MSDEAATLKVTKDRADDADDASDHHQAGGPIMSMAEQEAKRKDDEEFWGYHCDACGYDQFSPMVRCPKCRESKVSTRKFSTTGKVVSYTIQSVAAEQFMNEVPFAWAIIKLDDGPQVSGWIPWISKAEELPLGSAVTYVPSYKPGVQFEKA